MDAFIRTYHDRIFSSLCRRMVLKNSENYVVAMAICVAADCLNYLLCMFLLVHTKGIMLFCCKLLYTLNFVVLFKGTGDINFLFFIKFTNSFNFSTISSTLSNVSNNSTCKKYEKNPFSLF